MIVDATTRDRPARYQDVLDAPPNVVAEIAGGRLHTHPRPASPQAYAATRLGGRLDRHFNGDGDDGPGGWWIVAEPELHLGSDVLVPDVAGWRHERMSNYPDAAFFTMPPDWICEVLSPSTRKFDRYEKRAIYAREGVGHLWLVDPIARGLEAFALRDGAWVLLAAIQDEAQLRLPPFDAVGFPLSVLWPPA